MLLTSMAYNILSVLIETHHGVSSITFTLQALLDMEKAQLEVEQERVRTEWELMLLMWNLSTSQDYAV